MRFGISKKPKLNLNKPSFATVKQFAKEHYPQEQLEDLEQRVLDNQNTILMLAGAFMLGLVVGAVVVASKKGD